MELKLTAATREVLIEYELPTGLGLILSKKDEPLTTGSCSISGLVGGKYIFVISDEESGNPNRRVVFYDIQKPPPYERTIGPSLVGAKADPTLIIMGSKLFAFSSLLFHKYVKSSWDSKPMGELLDTNSKYWKWTPLPRFPKLPYAKSSVAYTIVSFAVWNSTLFLSLGESADAFSPGVYSFNYHSDIGMWDKSAVPLPFRGEGKFVGHNCYGVPFAPKDSLQFESFDMSCYQLINNPFKDTSTSWVELCRYSLPSSVCPPIRSFFSLGGDVFAIIRVREARKRSPHLLDIDVVELVHSERSSKLLVRKSFPNDDGFEAVVAVGACNEIKFADQTSDGC